MLGEGKYIASNQGDYRILLPSENMRQIESYMAQADKKLRRAQKLSRNTPSTDQRDHRSDNIDARITMKRESVRGQYKKPASALAT